MKCIDFKQFFLSFSFVVVVNSVDSDPATLIKEETQSERNGVSEDKPKTRFGSRSRVFNHSNLLIFIINTSQSCITLEQQHSIKYLYIRV